MEDTEGIVKLVAHKGTRRLLGAHIMGHEAALLIQPLIQAMVTDLDLVEMARGQFWIHPALSEVVENALLSLGLAVPSRGIRSDPAPARPRGPACTKLRAARKCGAGWTPWVSVPPRIREAFPVPGPARRCRGGQARGFTPP